jgi:hypothetical protein
VRHSRHLTLCLFQLLKTKCRGSLAMAAIIPTRIFYWKSKFDRAILTFFLQRMIGCRSLLVEDWFHYNLFGSSHRDKVL